MSNAKMPEWLRAEMEQKGEAHESAAGALEGDADMASFMVGARACYAALLSRAPEFDEGSCGAEFPSSTDAFSHYEAGARWQHAQLAAMIAARDAEIERLKAEVLDWRDGSEAEARAVDRLAAKVERLREALRGIEICSSRDDASYRAARALEGGK